jgi:iduronate 2-sulfatase
MNVLFIAIDDLRPQLGVGGRPLAHTPHMDKFAASALLFENAHAQIAHCSPSRNSLMSGKTPDSVKVWNFIDDFRDPSVGGDSTVSLPQFFKQHGYYTAGSGKIFHPGKPKNNDQTKSWSAPSLGAGGGGMSQFQGGAYLALQLRI